MKKPYIVVNKLTALRVADMLVSQVLSRPVIDWIPSTGHGIDNSIVA